MSTCLACGHLAAEHTDDCGCEHDAEGGSYPCGCLAFPAAEPPC